MLLKSRDISTMPGRKNKVSAAATSSLKSRKHNQVTKKRRSISATKQPRRGRDMDHCGAVSKPFSFEDVDTNFDGVSQ